MQYRITTVVLRGQVVKGPEDYHNVLNPKQVVMSSCCELRTCVLAVFVAFCYMSVMSHERHCSSF